MGPHDSLVVKFGGGTTPPSDIVTVLSMRTQARDAATTELAPHA